jgi:hypothetical protein
MKVAIDLRPRKHTIKTNERLSRHGWWMRMSMPSVLVVSLAPMLLSCGIVRSLQPRPAICCSVRRRARTAVTTSHARKFTCDFHIAIPHVGSLWNGVIAVTVSGGTTGLTVTPASFSVDTTQGTGETVTLAADSSLAPGFTEGFTPDSTITIDQHGNLYGTTEGEGYQSSGNRGNSTCHDGCGTVFKLTKSTSGWQETTSIALTGLAPTERTQLE